MGIAGPVVGILAAIFFFFFVVAFRIKKAGPNEVLVISGMRRITKLEDGTRVKVGFRLVKGGMTFVIPILEKVDRLSLEIMTLDVRTPEVYTIKGVPVIVDGIAQIKIKGDSVSISTAAEQFLSMGVDKIANVALQTVEGHLRAILGTLTVEEIYSNRDMFAQKVQEVASSDSRTWVLLSFHSRSATSATTRDTSTPSVNPVPRRLKETRPLARRKPIGTLLSKAPRPTRKARKRNFVADTGIAQAERITR